MSKDILEKFIQEGISLVRNTEQFFDTKDPAIVREEVARFLESCSRVTFPDFGISGNMGDAGKPVLIQLDPLNDPESHKHGQERFQVSYALLVNNVPEAGILYNPKTGEVVFAIRGLAALCEYPDLSRDRLLDPCHNRLATSTVALDRHSDSRLNYTQSSIISRSGGICNNLVAVARGSHDVKGRPWPPIHGYVTPEQVPEEATSAARVVLGVAGFKITDLDGNELEYNKPNPVHKGIVASSPNIHEELRQSARYALSRTHEELAREFPDDT